MSEPVTIAFLGTGLMGAPMATRLIRAGYDVRVWNRTPEKIKPLIELGGYGGTDPAAAVREAHFVCLCLTDEQAVGDLLFGPPDVARAIRTGATLIDFSTIGVSPTRNFAKRLATLSGAEWLDCPVSGGVGSAEAGSLIALAGGTERVVESARPLLGHLASRVTRMGDVGSGQAAKLCNQLIVSTNLIAIAEAMAIGAALKIDITRLPMALKGGFADSIPLQLIGSKMASRPYGGPLTGEIRTMLKDVEAIVKEAAAADITLPLLRQAEDLYRRIVGQGLGAADLAEMSRFYDTSSDEEPRHVQ